MKLSLLYNAPGPEAGPDDLDTVDQVREIRGALETLGYRTEELIIPGDLVMFRSLLRERSGNLFFNLSDPRMGEGRFIVLPVLALEQERCRYTGCTADSLYLTSNKLLAKRLMLLGGIPTPRWFIRGDSNTTYHRSADFVPGLFIVKSIWEHGSAELTSDSVFEAACLKDVEDRLNREPKGMFAEAFLPGREINIGLLGNGKGGWDILSPSEILYTDPKKNHPFLDYSSKWDKFSDSYQNSSRSLSFSEKDRPLLDSLRNYALRCTGLFGLNGYARIDFRLDASDQPMVMEINANPCLTRGAGFAAAAEKTGIAYQELVKRIIASPAGY